MSGDDGDEEGAGYDTHARARARSCVLVYV